MEATRTRLSRIIFVTALAFTATSCASARKGDGPQTSAPSSSSPWDNSQQGSQEVFGPGAPEKDAGGNYGPVASESRPVVVVLGPGLARGFAHAGALRALQESRIRIAAILGTEMGGAIGALFAMSKSVNQFDFNLQRLKNEYLWRKPGLFSGLTGKGSDGKEIRQYLVKAFAGKDIKTARIPLRLIGSREGTQEWNLFEEGAAAELVRATLSLPGFLEPFDINGQRIISSTKVRPYPVVEARQLGLGPVIVIDVIGNASVLPKHPKELDRLALEQMSEAQKEGAADIDQADLVIRPVLDKTGLLDFEQRTEIVFRGKKAVLENLGAIREMTGSQ